MEKSVLVISILFFGWISLTDSHTKGKLRIVNIIFHNVTVYKVRGFLKENVDFLTYTFPLLLIVLSLFSRRFDSYQQYRNEQ